MAAQSQWLTDTLAAILAIAIGGAAEAQTQAQVTKLAAQLGTDEGNAAATNAEFQTAITALVKQLAAAPPPVGVIPGVTGISPASGPIAGGTSVAITGTGLTGATVVNFGAVAATGLTVNSDTSVSATSPAGVAGVADVTVTTPGGVSAATTADQFTYS